MIQYSCMAWRNLHIYVICASTYHYIELCICMFLSSCLPYTVYILYIWHIQCTTVRQLFCERGVYSIHICMHLFTFIILYTVYSINTNYYIFQLLREQTEVAHPPLDSSSLWLDRKGLSFEPGAPSDCCERGPATKGGVLSQVRKESIQWRLHD